MVIALMELRLCTLNIIPESNNTILIRGDFDVCRSRLLMMKETLMASYQSWVAVIHSCWQVALGPKCSSITTCKPITPGVRKVQANNTKLKLLVLKFSVLPSSGSSGWVGMGDKKHEIYTSAFWQPAFHDLFFQGRGGWGYDSLGLTGSTTESMWIIL